MADLKISALPASTTPLAGTEVLPVVQSGSTKQVSVANLTAGRTVGTGALNTTGKITVNLDGAVGMRLNNTTGGAGQGIEMLTASTKYSWLLGAQYNVNDGFEITPSTAVGGTSFTTPAFKLEYVGGGVFNATIGTGNLAFASGKGIDFSATPGTGTSELLADYEEGTFTATLTSATPPTTPITATAYYTKIGDTVTVYCSFRNVNNTGAAGAISVTGLPFTSNASNYAVGPVWCSRSTITTGLAANVSPSSTTITLLDFSGNTVSWLTTGAGVYAGFEITYKV